MRLEIQALPGWQRGVALASVALLGLVTVIGSGGGGGGGALGFPPCTGAFCETAPPPPTPMATIEPAYFTALVGTPVTYSAEVANVSGTLTYQWRRSSNGGGSYADIAGATGRTLTLASVNLADDATQYQVEVRSSNGTLMHAVGQLVVSATPGLVFSDGEFLPSAWAVSSVDTPVVVAHSDERVGAGGNPGAYRRMVFQVPSGAGSARVFYAALNANYDPRQQGGIRVIDYAEDCIALQSSQTTFTQSSLVIEQSGRRFLSNNFGSCVATSWRAVAGRAGLEPPDFRLFDGPACPTGTSCVDFSASAAPMRFGYWRISFGVAGDSIAHGIDNWKVTVWRR